MTNPKPALLHALKVAVHVFFAIVVYGAIEYASKGTAELQTITRYIPIGIINMILAGALKYVQTDA